MRNTFSRSTRTVAITLICAPLIFTISSTPARADHPIVLALIAAAATTQAAVISGGSAITVAVIAAGASIYVAQEGGDGSSGETEGGDTRNEDDGDDGDDGEEEESSVSIGPDAVPLEFQEIIQRKLTLTSLNGVEDGDKRRSSGQVSYSMDGDVKRAEDTVKRFGITDQTILHIEVTGIENAEDAPIHVELAELSLSTEDIPQTKGGARARLTALQDGKKIWSWNAEVNQGKTARLNAPDRVKSAVVKNAPDTLIIRDLSMPVPYTAPGAKGSTVIEIVLDIEGVGART